MLHDPPDEADSTLLDEIKAAYAQHPVQPQPHFTQVEGLFYHHGRLVIPDLPSLRQKLMQMSHDSPWVAHGGRTKTSTPQKDFLVAKNA